MSNATEKYSLFATDCPRCGQGRTTFDILSFSKINHGQTWDQFESFMRCRNCFRASMALLIQTNGSVNTPDQFKGGFINPFYRLERWVFEIPGKRVTPDYVPAEVARIFEQGASCAAIECWDAAGTMFRKALDAATRSKINNPESISEPKAPNWKTYKDLRLRLDWLFSNNLLDRSLEDLSSCIHQDGNDAAHDDIGIGKEEVEDLADFTERVLQIIYTLPGQILLNKNRRDERRAGRVS